jgi:hypothetical protein
MTIKNRVRSRARARVDRSPVFVFQTPTWQADYLPPSEYLFFTDYRLPITSHPGLSPACGGIEGRLPVLPDKQSGNTDLKDGNIYSCRSLGNGESGMKKLRKALPLLTLSNTSSEAYLFAEPNPVTMDHHAIEDELEHQYDR